MSSKGLRLLLLGLALLSGCQKDINHRPANIAVTSLVSLGTGGIQGNFASTSPSATPDGRYVAFVSASSTLVSANTGGFNQVYRRDLVTGETILVSVDDAGVPGDKDSDSPSISADGLRIAFRSPATNFSVDANGPLPDIYVRDLSVTPATTLLMSAAFGGGPNDGMSSGSYSPSISQDGKYVAFICDATNLISPPLPLDNVHAYRRSVDAGTRELVDLQPSGAPSGFAVMVGVSISDNGRYVAFDSTANDLGGPPIFGFIPWVYIRDMTLSVGALELASVPLDPAAVDPSTLGSFAPSLSADGRVVAFHSAVTNLVLNDTNGAVFDIFVRDLRDPLNPRTTLASLHSSGAAGSQESQLPVLAPDGRSVAFKSLATNLVDGDFNGKPDVFWHELSTGRTVRVSVNTALQEAIGSAGEGFSLTADGRFVFFSDEASNLVTGDLNGTKDVFLRGPLY